MMSPEGPAAERIKDMFDTVKIGRKIAELRKSKNMTQFELADAMGVSFQAVSNWERGNSMPDISKLAELSEILGTTVDELLGKKNPVVEKIINNEKIDTAGVSRDEILEAAEISKPDRVRKMIDDDGIADIAPLLPFLDEAYIAELADKYYDGNEKGLVVLLPFLGNDKIDELMERSVTDGRDIVAFLPFASDEKVGDIARRYMKDGKGIEKFLPFLDENDIGKIAADAYERDGKKGLVKFLPFIGDDDVKKFADIEFGKDGIRGISMFLPFLDEDDVKKFAKKTLDRD